VEGVRRGDSLVFYVCIGELLVVLTWGGLASEWTREFGFRDDLRSGLLLR
jgi:hypothetical protein